MWAEYWDCVPNVNLTDAELDELKTLLSPGHEVTNNVVLPFENYWVQQVYKGQDSYYAVDKDGNPTTTSVLGSNQMDLLLANNSNIFYDWDIYNKHQFNGGYYDHVNNFNNGDNQTSFGMCGCGIEHIGTTLMTDMDTTGFDATNQFGYHETWGTLNKYRNNYIIVQYKGEWYVGFDYQAETDRQNPGEASNVERDWCFTDWIVKITPAYHKDMTPDDKEPEITPTDPPVTENPTDSVITPKNEVETNLSVSERKDGTLDTHTSIHVRAATDVEIFIPVPMEYYCEVDDMAIVQWHEVNHMIHGGPLQTEYVLQDKESGPYKVTLNVAFEANGIRIWTDGITQDVINFCYKHHEDGLTFEIWNYFDNSLSKDVLKEYLNQATIKFLDKEPDLYVNAFNQTDDGNQFNDDCTISIIDEQRNDYGEMAKDNHRNGSSYNEKYYKK